MPRPPIQTLHAKIDWDWVKSIPPAHMLRFPSKWYRVFEIVAPQRQQNKQFQLPISELNRLLPILFGDIVLVHRYAGRPNGDGRGNLWIVANRPIAVEDIVRVVDVWGTVKFKLDSLRRKTLQEGIYSSLPEWEPYAWRFDRKQQSQTDTFQPDGDAWTVPHLLTRHTTQLGERISSPQGPLSLYPVISESINSNYSRLVSWQPFLDQELSMNWRWSWQTLPGVATPQIYLHMGTTRWQTRAPGDSGAKYWQFNERFTVYLRVMAKFLGDYEPSPAFCETRFRYRGDKSLWEDDLGEILDGLGLSHKLPSIQDVVREPKKWMAGNEDMSLGVQYRNLGRHTIKSGWSEWDIRDVFEQVRELFPMLSVTKPLVPVSQPRTKRVNLLGRKWKQVEAHARSHAFARSVGMEGEILVLSQSADTEMAVLTALRDTFNLGELPLISIRSDISLEECGDVLRLGESEADRSKKIAELLNGYQFRNPLGAIVELENYGGNMGDPKMAIRKGLAMAGFVSQFVVPVDDASSSVQERLRNAVRDLGRSMGFLTDEVRAIEPFKYKWIMGLWTASGSSFKGKVFPIVTRFEMDTDRCEVLFPGAHRWLSYRDAVLTLASSGTQALDYREAIRWWSTLVNETMEDTLLVVDHRSRRWWNWLGNSHMTKDHVELGIGEQVHPAVRKCLQVVRCRSGDETPQWYIPGDRNQAHTSGVFKVCDGVWFSLQSRPENLTLPTRFRRLESPQVSAWNPQLVELVPVGFHDVESAEKAVMFVHQLRKMNAHYDSATLLPLPVHVSAKLAENISSSNVSSESDMSS